MLAVIHKLETYTITFLIRDCCSAKLQKVLLNDNKTSLEVGMQVYFEAERSDKTFLPKLATIKQCTFDNCPRCELPFVPEEIYLPEESQINVSLLNINLDLVYLGLIFQFFLYFPNLKF